MKKFVNKLIVFSVIIIIFIVILNGIGENSIGFGNAILFFFSSLMCVYGIVKEFDKHSFSLVIMHWIFILIFFVIAPVIQISFGLYPWNTNLSISEISFIQIIIILWSVCFNAGIFLSKNTTKDYSKIEKKYVKININKIALLFLTILSIISAIIIIRNVGFSSLFSRSTSIISYDGNYSKMKTLIVENFTKVTILFSTVASYICFKKTNKGLIYLLINVIVLLITCFPTGLSRNTAGIIYMGLFVIAYFTCFYKIKSSPKYILLFLLAFIVFFPAINVFRNKSLGEINIQDTFVETVDNISENYLSGDYDAFVMIGNIRRYTNDYGIMHGKQLIGNLLFFVPRNIWKDKPVGSGSLVFSTFGRQFTNVSCPLVAEFYLNFGLLGVTLGGLLFGVLCARIDKTYWFYMDKSESTVNYITLLYPFLVPSFFFMMRGDFLSTFSYTTAYICLFWIYSKIININFVYKTR